MSNVIQFKPFDHKKRAEYWRDKALGLQEHLRLNPHLDYLQGQIDAALTMAAHHEKRIPYSIRRQWEYGSGDDLHRRAD
ncbi:hypothetical protein [Pseudovibrio exalbescens]|uniref:hypothetical protein n=1 Tax=Pseudovibrio exalbescens TaxID=197461 RepID=UPI0015E10A70|nr:hypothetical protein [Pseudovibrio exalbescens]